MPTKKTTQKLVPELRFPEFRNYPGFKQGKLNDLLFETKQRNRELLYSKNDVLSVSGEHGCVNQIEFMGRSYAGVSVKDYHIVETGDIVYTKSPLKRNPFGIIKQNKGNPGIVSTLYAVYRTTELGNPNYIEQYFSRDYNLNSYLQPIVRKGAKNDMKVNNADVLTGNIWIPSPPEQQKIADCLGSLDELIAAHRRKLAALQDHKKGLLQQLFPKVAGASSSPTRKQREQDAPTTIQTTPNLRFPGFEGEWEETKLGPLTTKVGSGVTPKGGSANYKAAGRPFVRSQNVGWGILLLDDIAYIDDKTHHGFAATEIQVGDVLLNITGASIGRCTVANCAVAGGNVNQHVCIIRTKPQKLEPHYLCQFIISQLGQAQIDSFQAGGNRQGLNFEQIRSFLIPRPPTRAEQQKIADCLSALDALITAQTEQIAALQAHKKGLMQKLFPSPEAVA